MKCRDPVVVDRYVPWIAYPLEQLPMPFPEVDSENDWSLLCASAAGSSTSAVVRRKLTTGDKNDRAIVSGSMPVVYAWGTGPMSYHGPNRGSAAVTFFGDTSSSASYRVPADADGR